VKADHPPLSSAEVKRMSEAIPPLHQYSFMAWCLVKHRDNFTVVVVVVVVVVIIIIIIIIIVIVVVSVWEELQT
jgi:hypothetical protein